jgi:cytochrome c
MKRIALFFGLVALTGSCVAIEMPQSAKDIGCPNCHAIDRKVVGPAWMEVSKRYRDKRDDPAFFDQLVKKVSKGGSGHWGDVPMVANDPAGTKHDKIVELVKFILALSN